MNIIAYSQKKINIDFEEGKEVSRWAAKKMEAIKMADLLLDAGLRGRAARMRECGSILSLDICPKCGKVHIASNLCRDRLCPVCSWRLSLKRYVEMLETLALVSDMGTYTAAFLTVTVKNCKLYELNSTIKYMSSAWHRMTSRRTIKRQIAGIARSVEVTYSKARGDYHPHFHAIILLEPESLIAHDFAAAQKFFKEAWEEALDLGYSPVTDFRYVKDLNDLEQYTDKKIGAVCETFKYSVKPGTVENLPKEDIAGFAAQINGLRMTSYSGVFKVARQRLGISDDETEPQETDLKSQSMCCGVETMKAALRWSYSAKRYEVITDLVDYLNSGKN